MPTYMESEIPTIVSTGNNGGYGGMWGGDGSWWIAIFLIFAISGWGRNGFGGFGGNNGGADYELGKLATTNDVASGFSTSTIMSNQRDTQLALQQGFSSVQQTLCQGFSGVNSAIERSGYESRLAINDLGYKLQDCCCTTQRAIDNVNYNMAKNTCDIIRSGQDNTRQILDFLTHDKISSLQAENSALTAQLSQNAQTRTIIDSLLPVAKPAYLTCSPYASAFGYPYPNNGFGCNSNCGF